MIITPKSLYSLSWPKYAMLVEKLRQDGWKIVDFRKAKEGEYLVATTGTVIYVSDLWIDEMRFIVIPIQHPQT